MKMAKVYSVRYSRNYSRRADGTWKLHSSSITENGYTKTWPTVEAAEQAAHERMSHIVDPEAANFIQYCKVYLGNEFIKKVER
jgi:hypothetical protein